MNILITGCEGFLAKELSSYYKNTNHNLYLTNRKTLDISDPERVELFFRKNDVDVVLHTAIKGGRRDQKESLSDFITNLIMYQNLKRHAEEVYIMINFGSGAEFGRDKEIRSFKECQIHESMPLDFYGAAKNIITKDLLEYERANIINFRLFGCFGSKESSTRMIKHSIKRYINKKPIIIHQDKEMDYFYVQDMCKVIDYYIDNFDNGLPRDINLCYNKKTTLKKIANIVNSLNDHRVDVIIENKEFSNAYTGDGSKLQNLGLRFRSLKENIKDMYQKILKEENDEH